MEEVDSWSGRDMECGAGRKAERKEKRNSGLRDG